MMLEILTLVVGMCIKTLALLLFEYGLGCPYSSMIKSKRNREEVGFRKNKADVG